MIETSTRRNAVIGALVGSYAVFDSLVLLATLFALVAVFDPVGVYLGSVLAITAINLACCSWVDRSWEHWVASGGARRLERQLVKLRESSAMRRPVGWITGGSTVLFALAAAVINPVLVVGAGRAISGRPVGEHRVRVASLAYAVTASTIYLVLALAVREAIRSL